MYRYRVTMGIFVKTQIATNPNPIWRIFKQKQTVRMQALSNFVGQIKTESCFQEHTNKSVQINVTSRLVENYFLQSTNFTVLNWRIPWRRCEFLKGDKRISLFFSPKPYHKSLEKFREIGRKKTRPCKKGRFFKQTMYFLRENYSAVINFCASSMTLASKF